MDKSKSLFEKRCQLAIQKAKSQGKVKKAQMIQATFTEYKRYIRQYPLITKKINYCDRLLSLLSQQKPNLSKMIAPVVAEYYEKFGEKLGRILQLNEQIDDIQKTVNKNLTKREELLSSINHEILFICGMWFETERCEFDKPDDESVLPVVMYDFVSNSLILSKIISLLAGQEIDVVTTMNNIRLTIQEIEYLRYLIIFGNLEIERYKMKIATIQAEIDQFDLPTRICNIILPVLKFDPKIISEKELISQFSVKFNPMMYRYSQSRSYYMIGLIADIIRYKQMDFQCEYSKLLSKIQSINPDFSP